MSTGYLRNATRSDLFSAQSTSGVKLIHRGCDGRIGFEPSHNTDLDNYVCGKCKWWERRIKLIKATEDELGYLFGVEVPKDISVYTLELHQGTGKESTYYITRPAGAYADGKIDTWKIR